MIEHIEQGTLAPNILACIALTSWKKRINTVGLTIYNLFETCGPDYHIVLTLAEEEFPKKEQELPRDLVLMNKAGVFEILWCKRNYKAFKKWLFCAERFPLVPIITADDDCLYRYNYAEELYQLWKNNPSFFVTYYTTQWIGKHITGGYATLYPPYVFKEFTKILDNEDILGSILACHEDDCLYACLRAKVNATHIMCLNKDFSAVAVSHDECAPLHDLYQGDIWKRHLETMWNIINPL